MIGPKSIKLLPYRGVREYIVECEDEGNSRDC